MTVGTTQSRTGALRGWFYRYRFSFLFVSLVVLLCVVPFFGINRSFVAPFFLFVTILSVIQTLDLSKRLFRFCLLLAIASLALEFVATGAVKSEHQLESATPLIVAAFATYALFFLIAIVAMLSNIFRARVVSADTIQGGIAVYLLIGFFWALLLEIVWLLVPDSFSKEGMFRFHEMVYYSFTTLTTLGYGDITPTSWISRNMAILEATLGPVYLAVLISRLVSLHTTSSDRH